MRNSAGSLVWKLFQRGCWWTPRSQPNARLRRSTKRMRVGQVMLVKFVRLQQSSRLSPVKPELSVRISERGC